MATKVKEPKGIKIMKTLDFKLDDKAIAEKLILAATLQEEIDELESQKKQKVDELNSQIKAKEEACRRHLVEGKAGTYRKEVEATEVKNFKSGMVEYWFDKKVHEQREMTYDERQAEFDLESKKTPKLGKNQKGLKVVEEPKAEQQELAEVIKQERSAKEKWNNVDGART